MADRPLAVVGGTVWTGTGEELPGATVLVEGDRIAAVGDVPLPRGAQVVRADGGYVLPGMVDAHTHLGLDEEGQGWEGRDTNETTDPVTPHLRAVDALNPRDPGLMDAVRAGVTAAYVTPGSGNVLGGLGAAVRTFGRTVEEMLLRSPAGLKAALGENPKRVYWDRKRMPSTRLGTAAVLREALVKAQTYAERQAQDPQAPFERDLRWEALGLVLRREIPLRVHAHRADDILTALRIAREFDLEVTIEHATEGYLVVEELAAAGVSCQVGPALSARRKVELAGKNPATPVLLDAAGVKVCLVTDHPVTPVELLPWAAGLAVREGMPMQRALRAVTLSPAEVLGVADRLGSITPGKQADLVVTDGHPFAIQSRAVLTLVAGRVAHRG